MKKAKQIYSLMFLGMITLLINGCKKEGPIGPAGPAGEDGKVNVASAIFTVNTWTYSSPYYYADLNMPELTSANIDSAAIMAYFSTSGSVWRALPYTQYYFPSNYFMGFTSSLGKVRVTWVYDSSTNTGDSPNVYYATTVRCRIVVIPAGMKKKHKDLDLTDYEAVKKCFNLND